MQQYLQKKKGLVQNVFDQVYDQYDLMNDFMSLGVHRIWKKTFIDYYNIKTIKIIKISKFNINNNNINNIISKKAKNTLKQNPITQCFIKQKSKANLPCSCPHKSNNKNTNSF